MTTTHIALVRGINVGGQKQVAMSDLRAIVSDLGLDDARSLLQSGNLVFRDNGRASSEIERLLENEVEKRLDLRTTFMVRTAKEWDALIAQNPFRTEAKTDPGHLLVICLKEAPTPAAVKALQAASQGPETIRPARRELYVIYPEGVGRSKLSNKLIEDKLGVRGTGRNWNTVLKLAALAHE